MSKKRKIILISVAVTVALVMGVGGVASAGLNGNNNHVCEHEDVGGHKLIGVGEMGYYERNVVWGQVEWWDTNFIITNPNCERDLTIKWVALIVGEDVCWDFDGGPCWDAEDVIFEGTPDDWYHECGIDIPGHENSDRGELSPHEVWQVSIAELIAAVWDGPPTEMVPDLCDLSKYTLEVTWSGAYYSWWSHWGRLRPLTGWQKEKCWYIFTIPDDGPMGLPGMAISEAEMKLFPSRTRFSPPEWWHLD